MGKDFSDHEFTDIYPSKRLKLFGFKLNPHENGSAERDEIVNLSSSPSTGTDQKDVSDEKSLTDDKKFECQFCYKSSGIALYEESQISFRPYDYGAETDINGRKVSTWAAAAALPAQDTCCTHADRSRTTRRVSKPSSLPSSKQNFKIRSPIRIELFSNARLDYNR
ncbi:unnamed protein product [Fraxinus pennsylvanica]|uniref:Uncharacterized protein n=1 Tax=Fraxinus pennsylvanica TaxID=56036 RepID=A0AAD2E5D2_9LAMI|nr:unnamed protein product [Fraxinus pennsylvanica]